MAFINSVPVSSSASASSSPFIAKQNVNQQSIVRHTTSKTRVIINASSSKSPSPSSENLDRRKFLTLSLSTTASFVLLPLLSKEPALADHTYAAARRSFDRYHPRILSAVNTIRDIGAAVAKNDAASAASLINDKAFSVKGKNAFVIYSGVFSDNYVTNVTRKMKKDTELLFSELNNVSSGGDDMKQHFDKALIGLNEYYIVAKLPMAELGDLKVDLPEEEEQV